MNAAFGSGVQQGQKPWAAGVLEMSGASGAAAIHSPIDLSTRDRVKQAVQDSKENW